MSMTLRNAEEGREYIIRDIITEDEDLNAFLFSLGCYSGEAITVIFRLKDGCVVSIKDGRYNIADLLVGFIKTFQEWVGGLLAEANPLFYALLVDGIIGGVGAVVGFLLLIMVMYFLIALLEDCGYMARVSAVLDPIFKKVGLSGKSVISFVIGTGCAIPGIMASRTIRNERERRATAMLTPFVPCGAKIPVIALIAGAFFDNAGGVSTVMYLSGILLIFIGAFLVNKIAGYKSRKSYFIIELPEYKTPSLWSAVKSMCARGWAYIVKAATIILLCNTVVQIMQTFDWNFRIAEVAGIIAITKAAASNEKNEKYPPKPP